MDIPHWKYFKPINEKKTPTRKRSCAGWDPDFEIRIKARDDHIEFFA